jgi:hypothetical protein
MTAQSKKKWVVIGAAIVVAVGIAVMGYFVYRYYMQNYGDISDSNSDTMSTDTSAAPDYRSSGIQDIGIANNNPGNLRPDGEPWHGMVGSNGGFMVFANLWYGIRAAVLNVTTLIKTYHTIQGYVTAYAPPTDGNNTQAYINAICAATGLQATDMPPLNNATLAAIARAHFNQENGAGLSSQYISDNDIQQGILLITDAFGNPYYPA